MQEKGTFAFARAHLALTFAFALHKFPSVNGGDANTSPKPPSPTSIASLASYTGDGSASTRTFTPATHASNTKQDGDASGTTSCLESFKGFLPSKNGNTTEQFSNIKLHPGKKLSTPCLPKSTFPRKQYLTSRSNANGISSKRTKVVKILKVVHCSTAAQHLWLYYCPEIFRQIPDVATQD